MISIFLKEFHGFLDSAVAYVVIGVFLIGIGTLTWVFPETSVLDYGYADMSTLFFLGPYALIFLAPAITMKGFAEEKKLGTLEFLFTKPLTLWGLMMGKFLASYSLCIIAIVPSLIYCLSIYLLGDPIGNLDLPGIVTSYLGLVLLGGVFCSIGLFASALTSSQLVAFVLGSFSCLVLYTGFDMLASIVAAGEWALRVQQAGMLYHYQSLSRGLIDSRDVLYFFSLTILMLAGTLSILKETAA